MFRCAVSRIAQETRFGHAHTDHFHLDRGPYRKGLTRYRFFGRSVLATEGAKLAGRPGGFGTCAFLGFLASLFPC